MSKSSSDEAGPSSSVSKSLSDEAGPSSSVSKSLSDEAGPCVHGYAKFVRLEHLSGFFVNSSPE